MKQITKDTVLKQGNKTYTTIEVEQGIVWVDKDAEIKDAFTFSKNYGIGKVRFVEKEGYELFIGDNISYWFGDYHSCKSDCNKIIAATFELEGIPKIELEDKNSLEKAKEFASNKFNLDPHKKKGVVFTETVLSVLDAGIECGYKFGIKANKAKWSDEDMIKTIDMAQEESWDEGGYLGLKYEPKEILQSLNSIKEIVVDENFKVISYE